MKTLKINQFDKKDKEIADALISLGMRKPAARMSSFCSFMIFIYGGYLRNENK